MTLSIGKGMYRLIIFVCLLDKTTEIGYELSSGSVLHIKSFALPPQLLL